MESRRSWTVVASTVVGVLLRDLAAGAAAAAVAAGAPVAPTPTPASQVILHGRTMTARFAAVPLGSAMAEVARASGAEVQWFGYGPTEADAVSVSFEDLPVTLGIERIVRPRSFLLFWSTANDVPRLSRIVVLSATDGSAVPEGLAGRVPDAMPNPARVLGAHASLQGSAGPPPRGRSGGHGSPGVGASGLGARDLGDGASSGSGATGSALAGDARGDGVVGPGGQLPFVRAPNVAPTPSPQSAVMTPVPSAVPSPWVCAASPRTTCRRSVVTGSGRLLLDKRRRGNVLVWRWTKGAATGKSAFGDPRASTSYALCIYDGLSRLVAGATVASGGVCGAKDCWRENKRGFRYSDPERTADGVRFMDLKGGADGKARIAVRGRGPALDIPTLPLEPLPLTVQLGASDGACWESTYERAIAVNRLDRLRATAE